MEEIYFNLDDVKPLSSRSSTKQEGPRRFPPASVLGLGLLVVFLLAGLIGLAVHYHNSVGGAAADLSAVKANLTERLQARDQLINQLNASLTEKTREVELLRWRMFGSSFYLLSTEKASWEQSRQHCTARGADLVIVDSEEEQIFLESMISEREIISGMINLVTWIGFSDTEEKGTWKWVDESSLNLNLKLWSPGQPDNGGGCVYIFSYNEWNSLSCEDDLQWICEKH